MIINDIEIPKDLLNAIENNNLVVFVGAGASMGAPTNMPDFGKLVALIESETGNKYNLNENEPYENYLGKLEHKGIDVHKRAVEQLSTNNFKCNDLHKFIIELFAKPEDIKIVTTNYDTMLEQVLELKKINNVNIYNSPALPLGNKFNGIVHIHGNVKDSQSIIITDEDFGKAYITEGYVSRFLIKLFESYNVLFIGYSYKDTIVKYLTRAITTYGLYKRYILIDSQSNEFELLGIQPICYGEGKHENLNKIVGHLAKITHRGLLEWKDIISEYKSAPPREILIQREFEYCLLDESKTFLLIENIHGEKWFKWLLEKEVFKQIFDRKSMLSKIDKKWAEWFVNEFFAKKDNLIINTIIKYNNQLSDELIKSLIYELDNDKTEISNLVYNQYIILLIEYINDGLALYRLTETSLKKELYQTAFLLFRKMLTFKMVLRKNEYSQRNEFQCEFLDTYLNFSDIWKTVGCKIVKQFPIDFIIFVKDKITDIFEQYKIAGMTKNGNDPLNELGFSLEHESYFSSLENVIYFLCGGVFDAVIKLKEYDRDFLKRYILECLQAESNLLKNLGLKLLRNNAIFSDNEKCELLLKYSSVYALYEKEQVFLLVISIFNNLSPKLKEKLLNEIGISDVYIKADVPEKNAYKIFNWCVWFKKNDIKDNRIDYVNNIILKMFPNFKERERPELNVNYEYGVLFDSSPKNEDEIFMMSKDELVHLLNIFREDTERNFTKIGLYSTIGCCFAKNYDWAFERIDLILETFNNNNLFTEIIISKISEANYTIDQHIKLLELFFREKNLVKNNDLVFAKYLCNLIKNQKYSFNSRAVFNKLYNFSLDIYNFGGKKIYCGSDISTKSLNCSVGVIVGFWIKLLSFEESSSEEKKYFGLFEKILNDNKYFEQILFVLVGNINLLYYRNPTWCKEYIVPYLTSKDPLKFKSSWEGIAFYSYEFDKKMATEFQENYLEAIRMIKGLDGEGRKHLVYKYTLLLVYVIKTPLNKFIPDFFENAEIQDRLEFISAIRKCLCKFGNDEKEKLWNSWLKKYWQNRIDNIPVPLDDEENTKMLDWCLKSEILFPYIVKVIETGVKYKEINRLFLISLKNSNLIKEYPKETIKLLIYMFSTVEKIKNSEFIKNEIEDIIKEINNIEDDLKNKLQEVLLKHQINCKFVKI